MSRVQQALIRAGRAVGIVRIERKKMSIEVPTVPEGIVDPSNLYNEVYGDLPPLAWSNPELHSKLQWAQSLTPFTVTAWYALVNLSPGVPNLTTSTMFRAEIEPGVGMDFDVRNVWQRPDLIVYALMRLRNPDAIPSQLRPYPGFAALHPPTASPIGLPWEPAPWPGRKVYRPAAGDNYAVGSEFDTPEARYKKVRVVTQPGQGPFGIGGTIEPAWEMVYSRA